MASENDETHKFKFEGAGVVLTKFLYLLNAVMAFGIIFLIALGKNVSTFPLLGWIAISVYGSVFLIGLIKTSLKWLPIVVFRDGFSRTIFGRSFSQVNWSNVSEIRFVKFFFKATESTRWKVIVKSRNSKIEISDYLNRFDDFLSIVNAHADTNTIVMLYCDQMAGLSPVRVTQMVREK